VSRSTSFLIVSNARFFFSLCIPVSSIVRFKEKMTANETKLANPSPFVTFFFGYLLETRRRVRCVPPRQPVHPRRQRLPYATHYYAEMEKYAP
jgi:hypothetical protein